MKPFILSQIVYWTVCVVLIGAAIATVLGFLGNLSWALGLLDHLRPHYVIMLLITGSILWVIGSSKALAKPILWLGIVTLGINLAVLLPFMLPSYSSLSRLANAARAKELTILHLNLDRENQQRDRVINYLNQQHADLLLLQEITPNWLTLLENALADYEVVTALPQTDSQGSALLKRISSAEDQDQNVPSPEIINTEVNAFPAGSTRPILTAVVNWQDQELSILSLHVTRPRNASTSEFQQKELEAIALWAKQQVQPSQTSSHSVVVLGDFNSTPWSQGFRRFQKQSGLTLARQGWGLKSTWPAWLPPWLQIPIDCCLHSPTLKTIHYHVGPNLGSDHRPITVELRLT